MHAQGSQAEERPGEGNPRGKDSRGGEYGEKRSGGNCRRLRRGEDFIVDSRGGEGWGVHAGDALGRLARRGEGSGGEARGKDVRGGQRKVDRGGGDGRPVRGGDDHGNNCGGGQRK